MVLRIDFKKMTDRVPLGFFVPHQIKWRNSTGKTGMIPEFVN